jgi:hypothetical protein
MFTNYSTIPIKIGILLVGFGLLVVGCDSSGPSADDEEAPEISYEVTNDLGDRIESLDGNGSSNAVTTQAKSSISFEATDRVEAPGLGSGDVRASHLSLVERSSGADMLHIGYKLAGPEYAGGIDIVAINSSGSFTQGTGSNALRVDGVDIQEVSVRETGGSPTALLAATAVEPGPFQRPPQFHSIDLDNTGRPPSGSVSYEAAELENPDSPPASTVAKSVISSNGGNYEAFTVSDVNSFHSISLSDYEIDDVDVKTQSGAEFRSVTQASSGEVYALSDGGQIYSPVSGSGLAEKTSLPSISSDFSIARMSSHRFQNKNNYGSDDFLFVSLNENGFRVYNTNSDEVVFSDTEIFATSVTATDDYVYVASGDGFAIYEVEDTGLTNTDLSDGLHDEGRASINDLVGPSATDAQVNHILATDDVSGNIVLYVAKSKDGVYRLEETSGSVYP